MNDTISRLLVLLIGLKLTGYITLSWWWILAPIWIPSTIALGILVVYGLIDD